MLRIAWRSLTAHKLRTILTTLAILLGVAMISGTYVLTDQIDKGFQQIFTDAYKGVDVTVTRKPAFTGAQMSERGGGLAGVARRPGAGRRRRGRRRRLRHRQRAPWPSTARSSAPAARRRCSSRTRRAWSKLQPNTFVAGRAAGALGRGRHHPEARQGPEAGRGLEAPGDHPDAARARSPSRACSRSPRSRRSAARSSSTRPCRTRRQWFDMPGQVSEIDVKGVAGVSPETLAGRVRAVVPPGVEVKTGAQAAADQTKQVSDAIGTFLKPALLSFGGIAVLVGAFIIFNAFSMTVAQRRREFAMVRALGASRRQVLVEHHRRGARDGRVRLAARPGRRPRHRRRREPAVQGDEGRHPAQRARARAADDRHRPRRRRPRDAALGGHPGGARDARAADRRAAGGRRAAAVALLALHAVRRRGRRRASARSSSPPACSDRAARRSGWARSPFGAVLVFVAVAMVSRYLIRPIAGALGLAAAEGSRRSAAGSRATTASATRGARRRRPRR